MSLRLRVPRDQPSDAVKEQLIMRKLCTMRQGRKDAFLAAGVRVTRNQSENYREQGILEATSQDLKVSKVPGAEKEVPRFNRAVC